MSYVSGDYAGSKFSPVKLSPASNARIAARWAWEEETKRLAAKLLDVLKSGDMQLFAELDEIYQQKLSNEPQWM